MVGYHARIVDFHLQLIVRWQCVEIVLQEKVGPAAVTKLLLHSALSPPGDHSDSEKKKVPQWIFRLFQFFGLEFCVLRKSAPAVNHVSVEAGNAHLTTKKASTSSGRFSQRT